MSIKSHEDLIVWQQGIVLVKKIYQLTELLPPKEKYRLVDQMCRAVVSIPSNIAEGSTRRSTKEYMRYINMSLGSLAELETHIVIIQELKYVDPEDCKDIIMMAKELGRRLNALYNALHKKITELRIPDPELQ